MYWFLLFGGAVFFAGYYSYPDETQRFAQNILNITAWLVGRIYRKCAGKKDKDHTDRANTRMRRPVVRRGVKPDVFTDGRDIDDQS